MPIKRTEWIFMDGEWLPWDQANVHVTAHGLHYGSSAFEGIRAYKTKRGTAIFRLGPHVDRLLDSCKIPAHGHELLRRRAAQSAVHRVGEPQPARVLLYPSDRFPRRWRARSSIRFPVRPRSPSSRSSGGRYLGQDGIEQGVDVGVSSWTRFNASTSAPLGKIGGQYVTSQFVSIEAQQNGYAEGILLDERGNVCEGAGETIFAVMDGEIITPPLASSILGGITRDSVITLAHDLGLSVRYASISRDMLYLRRRTVHDRHRS